MAGATALPQGRQARKLQDAWGSVKGLLRLPIETFQDGAGHPKSNPKAANGVQPRRSLISSEGAEPPSKYFRKCNIGLAHVVQLGRKLAVH